MPDEAENTNLVDIVMDVGEERQGLTGWGHFVYNFYEKEDGNYLTHQPLALTQSFFFVVVVIYFKRGRALFWGGA